MNLHNMVILIAITIVSLGSGCRKPLAWLCIDVEDCTVSHKERSDSICLFDGITGPYCAHPDRDCPSGWRWSEYSRASEECVDPALLAKDGGIVDGPNG